LLVGCGDAPEARVVLAAGTTVVDSGLLDDLVDIVESVEPSIEVSVVAESTAGVLELGRQGAADVLIVHAPELEAAFVAEGRAAVYEPVFSSRFVLVGPERLRPEFSGGVVEAFRAVAEGSLPFVSRADGSGTHAKEMEFWNLAGIDPGGAEWYIETGQGMGLTLQVADQRGALTLSELGAFLAASDTLSLVELPVAGDARLANPYHLIVVDGARQEAFTIAEYVLGAPGQRDIEAINQERFGSVVYAPAAPGR
jgi:tungstate transport system substrate-binding protein